MFLEVHVGHHHVFSDTGAHSEKIVSLDESIRHSPHGFLTSISFDLVDQAAPWLAGAFDFTFATLPEPGLNFWTRTEVLCQLIDLKFKKSKSAYVHPGWPSSGPIGGQKAPTRIRGAQHVRTWHNMCRILKSLSLPRQYSPRNHDDSQGWYSPCYVQSSCILLQCV